MYGRNTGNLATIRIRQEFVLREFELSGLHCIWKKYPTISTTPVPLYLDDALSSVYNDQLKNGLPLIFIPKNFIASKTINFLTQCQLDQLKKL